MWHKETKAECCIHDERPKEIECFMPELCKELQKLYGLHKRHRVRSRRIMSLAMAKPTKRTTKFLPVCPCRLQKPIEMIHLDQRINTRTEQLAYPKARNLLLFKEQIKTLFPPDRIMNLNRLIRQSLLSLYSRLGNVQPPEKIQYPKKWDRAEWSKHTKKLKKLARPKKPKPQPKIPSKRMSLQQMRRFKWLAKPLKRQVLEKPDWTLTSEMKSFKASERLNNLAKPMIRDTSMLYQELPISIPLTVLQHKASKRTKELSEPNARRTAQLTNPELRENPFAISANALKAKASKRTKELAEPKEYESKHIRENPYAISPAALKAKAKPRTIELAQPKK